MCDTDVTTTVPTVIGKTWRRLAPFACQLQREKVRRTFTGDGTTAQSIIVWCTRDLLPAHITARPDLVCECSLLFGRFTRARYPLFVGANVMCLPNRAKYNDFNANSQGGAHLYGYEYNPYVPGRGWGLHGKFPDVNEREVYF